MFLNNYNMDEPELFLNKIMLGNTGTISVIMMKYMWFTVFKPTKKKTSNYLLPLLVYSEDLLTYY